LFSSAAIADAVRIELAEAKIPAGHKHAVALVATTRGEIKGVLSTKINDVWRVDAVFAANKDHIEGAVAVTASW
jgi:hypothetical protein